jgi:O-antigen ligase
VEAGIDACGAVLIFLRWRRVVRAARAVWPLVGLAALAPLSVAWSAEPMLTLRRSALLLVSTSLAIYLGERYTTDKLARLLAQVLCLMMVAVIAFYFFSPSYVIDYSAHTGAWKGLSFEKNSFGEFMGIAVTLLLLVRFRHFPWLRYVFLAAAAVLLVLSHSASALACCVMTIAIMPLWRWVRLNRQQRLLVCTASVLLFCAGVYFVVSHSGTLLTMLGRDSTFTGRTQLWAAVWPAIMKRPVLGYGYDTFWAGLQGEVINTRITAQWLAPAADNGYIDLCLGLGFVGLFAFLYVFALVLRKAIQYIRFEPGSVGLWPVSYLCFYLAHSLSESVILRTGGLSSLLFAVLVTSLAMSRRNAVRADRTAEAYQMAYAERPILAR